MKKNFLIFIVCFFVCFSFFISCNKEKKQTKTNWTEVDGYIAVLFGLGYNEESFVAETIMMIQQKYGMTTEIGPALPIIFPKDFRYSGYTRVSLLPEILKEKKISALIVLGAAENMHIPLNVIKENMAKGETEEFPIISLFPQDDVLGIESASDLVYDFLLEESILSAQDNFFDEKKLTETEMAEQIMKEESLPFFSDIPTLVVDVASNIMVFKEKKQRGEKLFDIASSVFDNKKWKVFPYYDAESGLKSYNHFLLKKIENDVKNQGVKH
ncbi:MAG: hypothetical protein GX220_02920 [Treponema sp.]|nr:hypothetical protein [Treponema sp.]